MTTNSQRWRSTETALLEMRTLKTVRITNSFYDALFGSQGSDTRMGHLFKKMWEEQSTMNKCMLALGGSAFLTAAIRLAVPSDDENQAKPVQANSIVSVGLEGCAALLKKVGTKIT